MHRRASAYERERGEQRCDLHQTGGAARGKLKESFTAHPKIDPVTGEMLAFAYTLNAPYLRFYRINPKGEMVSTPDIATPNRRDGSPSAMVMMHDFAITATKVVFLHLPVVFNLVQVLFNKLPFQWEEANGAHIGVMSRSGNGNDIVWIEIEPCWVFHVLNAYDDASGNIVLEVSRHAGPPWETDNTAPPSSSYLSRYTINVSARTAKVERLDSRSADFPRINPSFAGLKHRYGYLLEGDAKSIIKYDTQQNTSIAHPFDDSLRPGEPCFLAPPSGRAEDDGYLMTYVYDRKIGKSWLYIMDATNMNAPPLAKIKLPGRVPEGFHGHWIPARQALAAPQPPKGAPGATR